ncbi:hypothetical protein HW132_36305 [Brasilonema sp. CT11]|nr:hypothetical protein [Brasilonema sp. CT11]
MGKSGVGKTSITLRFCRDTFQDGAEATIGYVCLIRICHYRLRARAKPIFILQCFILDKDDDR